AILDFNLKFDQGANAPSFVMSFEDAGSPFLFSDRQGVLNIVTFIDTPFTLQAGFNLTITGLFAAPGSPDAIGDFQFVDGYDAGLLLGTLSTSYNAQTGTLVITSSEDIELPDGINLTAQGRFSVIPEPASISIFAGLVAVAALTRRCRQRR
ncbi:MAG: hypothetical protein K0R17_3166, partial [Rariglobus sp.]|nr:hypothetical protein [Rariglobus sp.]